MRSDFVSMFDINLAHWSADDLVENLCFCSGFRNVQVQSDDHQVVIVPGQVDKVLYQIIEQDFFYSRDGTSIAADRLDLISFLCDKGSDSLRHRSITSSFERKAVRIDFNPYATDIDWSISKIRLLVCQKRVPSLPSTMPVLNNYIVYFYSLLISWKAKQSKS